MDPNFQGLIGIISIGIAGNFAVIGIFMRKTFTKLNAKNMFIISLLTDSVALLLPIPLINFQIIQFTTVFCKIYHSLNMIIPAYASWILVYTSLERYLSIVHSTKPIAELVGGKWFQLIFLLATFIFTVFYYYTQWLDYQVTYVSYDSMNNQTLALCYINDKSHEIGSLMDAVYSCLTPFIALITSSILIIYTLKQSRLRFRSAQNSEAAQRREKKDYEFAKTILSLDIIFLLFHFPYSFFAVIRAYFVTISPISPFYDAYMIIQYFILYLYYIGYANNFIIYMIFNKNFRSEFLNLFKLKTSK